MDRGIKDEGFVRRALEMADNASGRWIANQGTFNFEDENELSPQTHAALITSVAIYVQKAGWDESRVQEAIEANTCGKARALIDRYTDEISEPVSS